MIKQEIERLHDLLNGIKAGIDDAEQCLLRAMDTSAGPMTLRLSAAEQCLLRAMDTLRALEDLASTIKLRCAASDPCPKESDKEDESCAY